MGRIGNIFIEKTASPSSLGTVPSADEESWNIDQQCGFLMDVDAPSYDLRAGDRLTCFKIANGHPALRDGNLVVCEREIGPLVGYTIGVCRKVGARIIITPALPDVTKDKMGEPFALVVDSTRRRT